MENDVLHPGHHSIRLSGADYSRPAVYFVTICASNRRCILSEIRDAQISLKPLGTLAQECWLAIPRHFPAIGVSEFVVMPNHIHGIVEIFRQQGRSNAEPLQTADRLLRVRPGSLAVIIRSFKSAVTNKAHRELQISGEIWQRNYFERILRTGHELAIARAYIRDNPCKWEWDRENPDRSHNPPAPNL